MINCKFENGGETSLRHVTVGAIAVNDKGEILLVRRVPGLHRGNTYAIPGGFLDRDEDIKGAVLRELEEETGFKGEVIDLFRINDSPLRPKEDRQNVDMIYLVKIIGGKEKLNPEVTEFKWVNKYTLPDDDEFAFDHRDSILRYIEYLASPFQLPIVG